MRWFPKSKFHTIANTPILHVNSELKKRKKLRENDAKKKQKDEEKKKKAEADGGEEKKAKKKDDDLELDPSKYSDNRRNWI